MSTGGEGGGRPDQPLEQLRDDLSRALQELRFSAQEGAWIDFGSGLVRVASRQARGGAGHCDLDVEVLPRALPDDMPPEVEQGARDAVERLAASDDPYLRAGAGVSGEELDGPRLPADGLRGLELMLWKYREHLRHEWREEATDGRGRARFRYVSEDTVCGLQLLGQVVGHLAVPTQSWRLEPELAAVAEAAEADVLPLNVQVSVEGGSIMGSLFKTSDDELMLEFAALDADLEGCWVRFVVRERETGKQVVRETARLDAGALTIKLGERLDPAAGYELEFEPLPHR